VPDYEPGRVSAPRQYILPLKDLPSRAARPVYTTENHDARKSSARKPRTLPSAGHLPSATWEAALLLVPDDACHAPLGALLAGV